MIHDYCGGYFHPDGADGAVDLYNLPFASHKMLYKVGEGSAVSDAKLLITTALEMSPRPDPAAPPIRILLLPVTISCPAFEPIAILLLPVVL